MPRRAVQRLAVCEKLVHLGGKTAEVVDLPAEQGGEMVLDHFGHALNREHQVPVCLPTALSQSDGRALGSRAME